MWLLFFNVDSIPWLANSEYPFSSRYNDEKRFRFYWYFVRLLLKTSVSNHKEWIKNDLLYFKDRFSCDTMHIEMFQNISMF